MEAALASGTIADEEENPLESSLENSLENPLEISATSTTSTTSTTTTTTEIDRDSETLEQALARIQADQHRRAAEKAAAAATKAAAAAKAAKAARAAARSKLRNTGGLVGEGATKEEEELIKRKRAVVVSFNGIFRFSKDLRLSCVPCDQDLPESTAESLDADVNGHTTSMEHLLAWSKFIKRESDGYNKLLSSAIQDGVFVAVCDGLVCCNVCNNVISDSLSFLKRHLFNEKHRFKGAPLPVEAVNTYANPYGPAARKLTSLVSSNADLAFATDKGQLVVNCQKCEKLMPRGLSEVTRHLTSKMHTNAQRKNRPNTLRAEGDEEEEEEGDFDEVINLSDEEGAGGGGGGNRGGVIQVDHHHRGSFPASRKTRSPAATTTTTAAVAAANHHTTTTTTTRSRSRAGRATNLINADNMPRRTRGGVTKAKQLVPTAPSTSSAILPPVRRTFGGRGRKVATVVHHHHHNIHHHQQHQQQQPQHQTATIEMTSEDGTITESQIILMEAPSAAEVLGDLEGGGGDGLQQQQQHHRVVLEHDPNSLDENGQPRYHYIEVLHEEQVEFLDGEGNSQTATILGPAAPVTGVEEEEDQQSVWSSSSAHQLIQKF